MFVPVAAWSFFQEDQNIIGIHVDVWNHEVTLYVNRTPIGINISKVGDYQEFYLFGAALISLCCIFRVLILIFYTGANEKSRARNKQMKKEQKRSCSE